MDVLDDFRNILYLKNYYKDQPICKDLVCVNCIKGGRLGRRTIITIFTEDKLANNKSHARGEELSKRIPRIEVEYLGPLHDLTCSLLFKFKIVTGDDSQIFLLSTHQFLFGNIYIVGWLNYSPNVR